MRINQRPPHRIEGLNEREMERLIYEAFRQEGRFLPETPEEVARAESELIEGKVELPAHLRDPLALIERRAVPVRVVIPRGVSVANLDVEMACAARNGEGDISEEILRRMDEDEADISKETGDGK